MNTKLFSAPDDAKGRWTDEQIAAGVDKQFNRLMEKPDDAASENVLAVSLFPEHLTFRQRMNNIAAKAQQLRAAAARSREAATVLFDAADAMVAAANEALAELE